MRSKIEVSVMTDHFTVLAPVEVGLDMASACGQHALPSGLHRLKACAASIAWLIENWQGVSWRQPIDNHLHRPGICARDSINALSPDIACQVIVFRPRERAREILCSTRRRARAEMAAIIKACKRRHRAAGVMVARRWAVAMA